MTPLVAFMAEEAARPVDADVRAFGAALAERFGAEAVLFYGSALRTGARNGVLDFYVLTAERPRSLLAGRLWPEIRFERFDAAACALHAKVAVMPLQTFAEAAEGGGLDTTVWTRFVQPSRLVAVRSPEARAIVEGALAAAAATAARFAAVLGPGEAPALAWWTTLFRATYAAELRVEPPGREAQLLEADPMRWQRLLPLAWNAAGVTFTEQHGQLSPRVSAADGAVLRRAWARRRGWGRPLNVARLAKAALTAPGAAAYAAGKLARHTGIDVAVTPWRERHPLLAALPIAWRLRRRR